MTDLVNLGFRADTRGLSVAQRELDKTANAGARTDSKMNTLEKTLGAVGGAIAALGVTAAASKIIQYADSWSNLNTQLRQVTESEKDLISVREQLLQVSRDTRIELGTTVGLYAEMTRGTSEMNISSEKMVSITKTLNNLFLAGGKPLSEMTGAIRQLNQGFASGVLRGDEFNSVAEGAPKILDAMSAKLNMTRGELREFAATGGITAQVMVEALTDYERTAQKLADTVKLTFEQNLGLATTNITEFVGSSNSLTDAVDILGASIVDFTENLDGVVNAVGAAAAVVALSLTPAIAKYSASMIAAGVANLTAVPKVTGMSAALGVQAKQLTTTAVAARFLGTAWRFMLGPIGIGLVALGAAAAAFDLTSKSIDSASDSADEHEKRINKLTSAYKLMTEKQLGETYVAAMKRSNELDAEKLELSEKLSVAKKKEAEYESRMGDARSKATNSYTRQISELESKLTSVDEESKKVGESLSTIQTIFDDGIDSISGWNDAADSSLLLLGSFTKNLLALEDERQQLSLTSDEYEIYALKQKLIAEKYSPDMIASLVAQKEAIIATRNELKAATGAEMDFSNLVNQVESFGGAWTRTGNIVVDAFGSMSDAIGDYSNRMVEISKLQEKIDGERAKGGADNAALDKLQMKIYDERVSAEIDGYQALASGAASMFSEKTAAAKAFNAINQVLAVAEIALSYQKISAGTAETAAHVANETTKQGANALTAITSAFAAPFPINFATGAAMIGIMASLLGGSFGSGGGGSYELPKEGGTGSVLGDSSAQSGSIGNSMDEFSDIQIDQLAELRGIRAALNGLNSGIERLASQFAMGLDFGDSGYGGQLGTISEKNLPSLLKKMPSFVDPLLSFADDILGGIIGSFSSKKKKLVDSGISFMSQTLGAVLSSDDLAAEMYQVVETTKKKFWGLSKKTSTSTETSDIESSITQQMANIFGFIGESVLGAAESLLGESSDFSEKLAAFTIDIGDISFKDKTGDEIQAELEAIFSQQADLIAEYLVPSISEYQKVGEGAFETLQRVSYEQAVFNDALGNIGISLSDLSSLMQIEVSQAIISLIGGVEEFASLTNSYFENFYSESEQLSMLESSLTDVFDSLGLSLTTSKDQFRELVGGIDLTTAEGQALFATLMELNPALADYIDALDNLANDKLNLEIELLEKQGKSQEALALRRQMELDATDESLHALLKMTWALDDAAAAEAERAREVEKAEQLLNRQKSLQVQLLGEQGESEKALALQREIELAGLDDSLKALMLQIYAQQDLNKEREAERKALDELRATLESNVAFAEQQLEKARQAEINRLNLTIEAAKEAYDSQLESINLQREAYSELIDGLESNLSDASSALEDSRKAEIDRINLTVQAAQEAYNSQVESINLQRKAYNELIASLESRLSEAGSALEKSRAFEIDSVRLVEQAAQEAYESQLVYIDSQRSAYNDLINDLTANLNDANSALEKSRGAEIESIRLVEQAAQEAYNSQLSLINKQREAYNQLISDLQANVDTSATGLNASLNAEMSKYDDLIASANNSASEQINALNAVTSARLESLNQEKSIVSSIASKFGELSKSFTASEALAAARAGDFTKAGNIESQTFNTAENEKIGAAREAYAMAEIGKLADAQLSDLERSISATESSAQSQINAINNARDAQVAGLEAQKLAVEESVKALLGIDDSVLSLDEAIVKYQEAQQALEAATSQGTLDKLQAQEDAALALLEQSKIDAQAQIAAINKQVDTLLGIDSSVLSLSDAMAAYTEASTALNEQLNNGTLASLDAQQALAEQALEQAKLSANEQVDAINKQVDAALGIDNSVKDLATAISDYNAASLELNKQLSNGTLEGLDAQQEIAKEALEQAKASASEQIEAINKQVDAILNIDNTVLGLSDAIINYNSAALELSEQLNSGLLDSLESQESIALTAYEQVKVSAEAQIDAINQQIDTLLNIDNTVMGLADAIALVETERKALADIDIEFQKLQVEAQQETTDAVDNASNSIVGAIIGIGDTIGGMIDPTPIYEIWPEPPIDIWPTPPGFDVMSNGNELVNEIKALRKDMDNANAQIGENTKRTADSVRKLEYMQSVQ